LPLVLLFTIYPCNINDVRPKFCPQACLVGDLNRDETRSPLRTRMPARTDTTRCQCASCLAVHPEGKLFRASQLKAHLVKVLAEQQEPLRNEPSRNQSQSIEAVAAQVLALTVSDEGPDLTSQPSRLWASRPAVQQRTSSVLDPAPATSLLGEVVEAVRRLFISEEDRGNHTSSQSPLHSSGAQPTSEAQTSDRQMTKKERSRHTKKTLENLRNIKQRIPHCRAKLSTLLSDTALGEVESELSGLRTAIEKVTRRTPTIDMVKKDILLDLERLEARVAEFKILTPHVSTEPARVSCGKSICFSFRVVLPTNILLDYIYQSTVDRLDEIAQVSMFLGVVCTVIMGISRRAGDLVMGLVYLILQMAWTKGDGSVDLLHKNTLAQVPTTITAALSKFNLDGRVTIYAVCPACHCTYKPQYQLGSHTASYPERCTNRPKPEEEQCNEPLLQNASDNKIPLKPFVYHDFNDYLGRLLSRKDIEQMLDKSCDDALKSLDHPRPHFVRNIFDAEFIRSFEGPSSTPDKKTLFIERGTEGRFLFVLNVDFFSPEGMNIRGARTSCGIISMACINLDMEICYKPENMYIAGIIPGPREPTLSELNHYMRPLMDDMVVAWEKGVHFSRTALHPTGRLTRSAVAASVNDLPAARKAAGFAGHSSHFYCSVCQCWHRSTIGKTDFSAWMPRNKDELREHATRWRDATTSAEQEKLFNMYGIRWSEFWRLPYWNPTRQLVVDSMHCILEGLVRHHSVDVLELTTASSLTRAKDIPAFSHSFQVPGPDCGMPEKEIKQTKRIHALLVLPVDSPIGLDILIAKLLKLNTGPLKFVCNDLNCVPKMETRTLKHHYAKALVTWVRL
jgi:hypothetical protein